MKKITFIFLALLVQTALQARTIKIWDGTPVNNSSVSLTVYEAADGSSGTAVIVCPGGSYMWLDIKTEGEDVASWLASNGITAYLLRYRVGGWLSYSHHIPINLFPNSIRDLQRSIQIVRESSPEGLQLGLMGFSAGGHLVMSAAEFYGTDFLSPLGVPVSVPLRPDFVAPIYPVVTFSDERYVHRRSRRSLLGDKGLKLPLMRDSLSLEKHVQPGCPPVFLLNCEDDPIVEWHNSLLLDSALTACGVNHLYTRFKTGGHGFGATASKQNAEASQWQELFLKWLKSL